MIIRKTLIAVGIVFVIFLITLFVIELNDQYEQESQRIENEQLKVKQIREEKRLVEEEEKKQRLLEEESEREKIAESPEGIEARTIFGIELGSNISEIEYYLSPAEYKKIQAKNDQLEKIWRVNTYITTGRINYCYISSYKGIIYKLQVTMYDGSLNNWEALTKKIEEKYNTTPLYDMWSDMESKYTYKVNILGLGEVIIQIDHDSVLEGVLNERAEISLVYMVNSINDKISRDKLELKKDRINSDNL